MTDKKRKRDKSDYWDDYAGENEDFIAYYDRGGDNPGGITVQRKAKNKEERKALDRVHKKMFETSLKHAVDKIEGKKKGDSKFFPVKTKGK